jgi:hypothetical protein
MLSNRFEAPIFDHPSLANPDIYPTTRNSKCIRRNANAPMAENRNKWESARNIRGTVLGVIVLPFPGLQIVDHLKGRQTREDMMHRFINGGMPWEVEQKPSKL